MAIRIAGVCSPFLAAGLLLLTIAGTASARAASADASPTASRPPPTGAAANISGDGLIFGSRKAPALLKAAGVACTVTQAANIGTTTLSDAGGKKTGGVEIYEAACAEGLGYVAFATKDGGAIALDCIEAAQSGKLACMLDANRHPSRGLSPYLKAAAVTCFPVRARLVERDSDLKLRRYEVECYNGSGLILDVPLPDGSGPAPGAADCLQMSDLCLFTPHVESVAMLAHEVGAALGDGCRIADARFVGFVEAQQRELVELSCQKGRDGLLVELDRAGAVRGSLPCASTKLVGAACELPPSDTPDPLIVHAETSGASPPLRLTRADWLRRPDVRELEDLYPRQALLTHLAGQADLNCRTTVSGLLADCFVTDESPIGYDFGEAAMKMSKGFRMKPATVNGVAFGGQRISVPIVFALQ